MRRDETASWWRDTTANSQNRKLRVPLRLHPCILRQGCTFYPPPSNPVLLAGVQVLKYESLWCTFIFKPPDLSFSLLLLVRGWNVIFLRTDAQESRVYNCGSPPVHAPNTTRAPSTTRALHTTGCSQYNPCSQYHAGSQHLPPTPSSTTRVLGTTYISSTVQAGFWCENFTDSQTIQKEEELLKVRGGGGREGGLLAGLSMANMTLIDFCLLPGSPEVHHKDLFPCLATDPFLRLINYQGPTIKTTNKVQESTIIIFTNGVKIPYQNLPTCPSSF